MTRYNVLVFPCGSEIGLEIHRSLRYSTHFNLLGASSAEDHGRFVYRRYISGVPFVGDPAFGCEINRTICENEIDLVVPAHDSALLALAELSDRGMLDCKLVTSPFATCSLTRSKRATYQRFSGLIPTPKLYDVPETAGYPAFVKPDVGQGANGALRVDGAAHAHILLEEDPSLLLLEYLPGAEYTIDCFTNRDRKLLYCEGRSRSRISNGISVRSQHVKDSRFREIAETINCTIELRGAWFFQVKARSSGELVLMEIAPRVAGTMGLSRARGANLVLLSLFDALNVPVSIKCNDFDFVVDRALQSRYIHNLVYDRVYLDFDDTVVVDGKINSALMAFVYQCRNKGIPISLLTRHTADLQKTLRNLCMDGLFDEIVWLEKEERKADYIRSTRSIFIDDSWSERSQVQDICGIPVFDTHMIEVLLEEI